MQEMYQETLQDKRQYKKQILGSRDSFGKIFDITRKLDVIQPQKLFMEMCIRDRMCTLGVIKIFIAR